MLKAMVNKCENFKCGSVFKTIFLTGFFLAFLDYQTWHLTTVDKMVVLKLIKIF